MVPNVKFGLMMQRKKKGGIIFKKKLKRVVQKLVWFKDGK